MKSPNGKVINVYHTSWANYGRNFQVADLAKQIQAGVTDVSYAFFNLVPLGNGWVIKCGDEWAEYQKTYGTDGKPFIPPADTWEDSNANRAGNFGQLRKLKQQGAQFNLHLSVGGWTWSKNFSLAVRTQESRRILIGSIIQFFKDQPYFNGIDFDWEYLSTDGKNYGLEGNVVHPSDGQNFKLFLQELRQQMTQNGFQNYIIGMCVVAAPEKAVFNISEIHPLVDEIRVMTYDFHSGAWGETVTAHHANPRKSSAGIYSAEEAADFYISKGVPSTKLLIGVAFYSRGFGNSEGLGKSASGNSPDFQFSEEMGVVPYHMLPRPGDTEMFDEEAKAGYSYSSSRKVFNSYDTVQSVVEKCKIVKQKNLKGLIIWESAGHIRDVGSSRCLVTAMKKELFDNPVVDPVDPTPVDPTPVDPTPVDPTPVDPTPVDPTPVDPTPVDPTPIDSNILLTPYLYAWGYGNSVYKIKSCMDLKNKLGGNSATMAFVIADSTGKMSQEIFQPELLKDFEEFQKQNGKLIISCGGANGPYLEDVLPENELYTSLDDLLTRTNCRALDFDIEGAAVANTVTNSKLARVLQRLRQKYPNLYLSLTIPADTYGLTYMGIDLVKLFKSNNVEFNIINIMAMNIGGQLAGQQWGPVACKMGETVVDQLQQIYPTKTRQQLYKMLGITPMIGKNDDGSTFTKSDASILAKYVKEKQIGLLSFWAINRDQTGQGSLAIYSQVNEQDYEFFKAMQNELGTSVDPTPVDPTPVDPTPVDPTPVDPTPVDPTPVDPTPTPTLQHPCVSCCSTIDQIIQLINQLKNTQHYKNTSPNPPTPVDPTPVDPTPVDPTPVDPTPVDPTPVDPTPGQQWKLNTHYEIGDKVVYNSQRYECITKHVSLDPGWTPDRVPSLWRPIN